MQEMQEKQVWSLGQEDPLEAEMATHSSILAWRIPWTEEPSRLQPMRWQRVRHSWMTEEQKHTHNTETTGHPSAHSRIYETVFRNTDVSSGSRNRTAYGAAQGSEWSSLHIMGSVKSTLEKDSIKHWRSVQSGLCDIRWWKKWTKKLQWKTRKEGTE